MNRTHIHRVDVHFGDCDAAGIVFFPNFSRWMDEASGAFFLACGVPPLRAYCKVPHVPVQFAVTVMLPSFAPTTVSSVFDKDEVMLHVAEAAASMVRQACPSRPSPGAGWAHAGSRARQDPGGQCRAALAATSGQAFPSHCHYRVGYASSQ